MRCQRLPRPCGRGNLIDPLDPQVVDFLQVLRCIITPSFGWSLQSALAIRWSDPIYVIHFLVNQLFRRWFWYTLMILLVFVCEVSVARVVYLLAEHDIGKSPLKGVIDFFNRVVVNTILLSTIGWMLMPVECLYSYTEPVPFSDYVHTAGWGYAPLSLLPLNPMHDSEERWQQQQQTTNKKQQTTNSKQQQTTTTTTTTSLHFITRLQASIILLLCVSYI
jgi:hypothetical protein